MTRRQAVSDAMKVRSLLFHFTIRCWGCDRIFIPDISPIEWDHQVPLALGGKHHFENIRPMCQECHRKKTSGNGATSYGSDIHAIAKCKRIASGGKKVKRPMPKSQRKMQSRGFR